MQKWFLAATLAGVLGMAGGVAHSAEAVPGEGALRTIRANAQAAGANAAIYQWFRVNREVDRIAAAEKKAQKAMASNPALASEADALRQAVRELRAARLARDVDRIVESSSRLTSLCADLLAK